MEREKRAGRKKGGEKKGRGEKRAGRKKRNKDIAYNGRKRKRKKKIFFFNFVRPGRHRYSNIVHLKIFCLPPKWLAK